MVEHSLYTFKENKQNCAFGKVMNTMKGGLEWEETEEESDVRKLLEG